ncbi:TetR/AcrR family transcriptional regulator [Nocardia sp. NPDC049190]|uniref:TetR/AcrR family transcriptional regulator n=1 Tax=Nocardia sp. NPDC049190 TaxID=3155650 RepID=UPI0033D98828
MPRTGRPRSFDDDQVVKGAKDVFWRRGYAATSLRELKEELGVLPGSLYGAFGDKHALFLRALEHYADDTREVAASILADGPVLPRIGELLASVLAAASGMPGRGCMLGNTAAELLPVDEAARRVISDAFGALEGALEQALAGAQQAGEVSADIDCGAQARLLVTLVQGLHIVARAEPDPHRLDDVVHVALASLTPRRGQTTEASETARQSTAR